MNDRRFEAPAYLFLATGASCLVCIAALRANNMHMVKLRENVYATDKAGGDVRGALTELQHYVTGHMNTDLTTGHSPVYPPIQLKYTYERLLAANAKQVSNEQVYSDAQTHCEHLYPGSFSGGPRVPCIAEYVSTHGAAAAKPVPDSLYKYDFISPVWSPDLAGWTALISVVLLISSVWLLIKRLRTKRRAA